MSTFDAVIVGGGPAGASCALWLKLLGFQPCIVERRAILGGLQNESPYPNVWIASSIGYRGQQVARAIHENVHSHDIASCLNTTVQSIIPRDGGFLVNTGSAATREVLFAPYLVIASGVRPADGGLRAGPKLLIGPGKQIDMTDWHNKSVAILGGGDSAFENYEFIRAKGASNIRIYARTIKARREFLQCVPVQNVRVGPYVVDPDTMTVAGQRYDAVVALYGWTPSLEFIGNLEFTRTSGGFIATDHRTAETSIQNVFTIGEVAHRMHPCCVTSMADGVVAAKEIQKRIEAAGKGDYLAPAGSATGLAARR
ncbi:Thioredoxin reductase [Ralstonia psammae]|uniref:Thioredoxin reductase n=1 Tax=Ralstonia psammae TaxID=3058598 RepID=A0ABM9JYB2_9RALS|nr:NAD(P)/FAD-dependent oxidoreductase [Ralstonia sp. LMG 19083]CAJ0808361.1 Thioredoxin reductase [Ralstonia sp. LMG 19083]